MVEVIGLQSFLTKKVEFDYKPFHDALVEVLQDKQGNPYLSITIHSMDFECKLTSSDLEKLHKNKFPIKHLEKWEDLFARVATL